MTADSNSAQMIAVAPTMAVRIDASIPQAFRTRRGDPAEQQRAFVKVLKPGADALHLSAPEGVPNGDGTMTVMVPMPAALGSYGQADGYDNHFRSVVHTYYGVPFVSYEMERPVQLDPNHWECDSLSVQYLARPGSHTFLSSGGYGSGMSFEEYGLTGPQLDSDIPHPLLCTLPPRLFALPQFQYCTGNATMPLYEKAGQGAKSGYGTGVTLMLRPLPIAQPSLLVQRIIRCLQTYGVQVNDRDAASRKPECLAITGETSLPLDVCKEFNALGLTLQNFVVAPILKRYDWHTKPEQYP